MLMMVVGPSPVLDWSGASACAPQPCADCGRTAHLRDPDSGKPRHKVCAERVVRAEPVASAVAALGPERAKGARTLAPLRDGLALDVARFRARLVDLHEVWPPDEAKAFARGASEASAEPAVDDGPVVVVPCRGVVEGDPLPRALVATRGALLAGGWAVHTTLAVVAQAGVLHTSLALRCTHPTRGRAWATWLDGKAQGGQVLGSTASMGITEWRVATGSAPTPKPTRKRTTTTDEAPVLVDLDALVSQQ